MIFCGDNLKQTNTDFGIMKSGTSIKISKNMMMEKLPAESKSGQKKVKENEGRLGLQGSIGWNNRVIQLWTYIILSKKGRKTLKAIERPSGMPFLPQSQGSKAFSSMRVSSPPQFLWATKLLPIAWGAMPPHRIGLPPTDMAVTLPPFGPQSRASNQRGLFSCFMI